jgi:hypothetical protein
MTRALVPALAFLASLPAYAAERLPTRAEVEAALDAWHACTPTADTPCGPPLHRQLSRSACSVLPAQPEYPGRVLCRFSGVNRIGSAPGERFAGDCVYLGPDGRGGWRVLAYPDADMCE